MQLVVAMGVVGRHHAHLSEEQTSMSLVRDVRGMERICFRRFSRLSQCQFISSRQKWNDRCIGDDSH